MQPLAEDLGITDAKRPDDLPTVLSRDEVRAVLAAISAHVLRRGPGAVRSPLDDATGR